MSIYIILYTYLFIIYWYIDIKGHSKYKKLFYALTYIIFVLLSGLRYKIGGDTLGGMDKWEYYPSFFNFNWLADIETTINNHPDIERYQIGWFLYAMLCKDISNNFVVFQLITAAIINYSIFRTIKKYSKHPFLTLFIYACTFTFFAFEFEIMREALATSVFLLFAYDNFVIKKWFKYYIGTLLAFYIHPSALLMFILPLFRNLNLSIIKYFILFFIPSLVLASIGRYVLGDALNIFLGGEDFISQYALSAVDRETNMNYTLMYTFHPIILCLIVVFFNKYIKDKFYIPLLFLTIAISNMSAIYYTASRLCNYIIIIDYIALSQIIYGLILKYKTSLIALIIMIIYAIPELYQFKNSIDAYSKYFPYQNVIFKGRTKNQENLERMHYYPIE